MKNFFLTLALIFGISTVAFTQSQELNTIIETLVSPNNLDSYFEHQPVYYQDAYEDLKVQVEEMIEEEKSIKRRIQGKKRIRKKDQIVLDEANERLVFLNEDVSFLKEYISLWKSYENFGGKLRKEFQANYNSTICYQIETEYAKLEPYEYEVQMEELSQEIVWKEMVEGVDQYEKGERILIQPATTKWVKRKADRNCLSADPNDCLVWCLIEVPAEYGFADEGGVQGCPDNFQMSVDEKYCYRTISIFNEKGKTKRLVLKDKDFPDKEISIKEYSVVDCKN